MYRRRNLSRVECRSLRKGFASRPICSLLSRRANGSESLASSASRRSTCQSLVTGDIIALSFSISLSVVHTRFVIESSNYQTLAHREFLPVLSSMFFEEKHCVNPNVYHHSSDDAAATNALIPPGIGLMRVTTTDGESATFIRRIRHDVFPGDMS